MSQASAPFPVVCQSLNRNRLELLTIDQQWTKVGSGLGLDNKLNSNLDSITQNLK